MVGMFGAACRLERNPRIHCIIGLYLIGVAAVNQRLVGNVVNYVITWNPLHVLIDAHPK